MTTQQHFVWISILLVWPSLGLSTPQTQPPSYASFETMANAMAQGKAPDMTIAQAFKNRDRLVFLDAREHKEFVVSHIPNARWVGFENFRIEAIADIPPSSTIVVYCSVGYRSELIAERLREAGYTNSFNLLGSIFAWVNAGHPVVDTMGTTTNAIHGYNKAWAQWLQKGKIVLD